MADPPIGYFAPPRVRHTPMRKAPRTQTLHATPARTATPDTATPAQVVSAPRKTNRRVIRSTRAQTVDSIVSIENTEAKGAHNKDFDEEYVLKPTTPSPFPGTIEASLDAILAFHVRYPRLTRIVTALTEPPNRTTNWTQLLLDIFEYYGREVLIELLFMATRWLIPNEIVENREWMYDIYTNKETRNSAKIHLTLRYDMQREPKKGPHGRPMYVESPQPYAVDVPDWNEVIEEKEPPGPPFAFMPNIIPTVIVCPNWIGTTWVGDFKTRTLTEKMRHHATALDDYLLLTEDKVKYWTDFMLVAKTAMIIAQWQWLRENNQILLDMYQNGVDWEALRGEEGDEWFQWAQNDREKEKREKGHERRRG